MKRLAFIGAGSMAEAIFSGMIKNKFVAPDHIYVTNHSNRERLEQLENMYGLQTFTSDKQVVQDVDIVILSMKPADIEAAIASIKPYLTENHLLISVAAGVEIEAIESYVGFNIPVIRTMPNTSASVGLSATAICGGRFVTDDDLTLTEQLFQTIGITEVVAEDDIHAVTGLSGSGPAYV